MIAIPVALALVALGLALYALRLARKARRLADRSIEELTKARGLNFRGMATDDRLRALRAHQLDRLQARVPPVTDEEAARAVADWNSKKAEALGREIDDAARRAPWVRQARPMTTEEADAWVAERAARLRRDLAEGVVHHPRKELGGQP